MKKVLKYVGEITIKEKIVLSDPCYEHGIWCSEEIDNMLPGTYDCFIKEYTEIKNGKVEDYRVTDLIITHSKLKKNTNRISKCVTDKIGVDSGTCGIYAEEYYKKYHTPRVNDAWYDKYVCYELEHVLILVGKGIISSAGYGDGSYGAYIKKEGGKTVGVRINYI